LPRKLNCGLATDAAGAAGDKNDFAYEFFGLAGNLDTSLAASLDVGFNVGLAIGSDLLSFIVARGAR